MQSGRQHLEDCELDTLRRFKEWCSSACLSLSSRKVDLVAASDKEDEVVDLMSEVKDAEGFLWYEVCFSTAYMPKRHMEIFMAMGDQPEHAAIQLDTTLTDPWDLPVLDVRWKPSMELAQPESAALPADPILRARKAYALDPQRLYLDLTDLQQQGHEPRQSQPWKGVISQAKFTAYILPCPRWKDTASIWYTDGTATMSKNDGTVVGSGA